MWFVCDHFPSVQGKVVGVFKKNEFSGDFVDGWKTTLDDSHMTQVRQSHDLDERTPLKYTITYVSLLQSYKINILWYSISL